MIHKFTNGRVILGNTVADGVSVYTKGDRIIAVTKDERSYDVLHDAGGKFISPGFIDMHVHGGFGCIFQSSVEEALKMAKKLQNSTFDLEDYLKQFEQISKMGDLNDIVGMIPGASKLKLGDKKVDEKQIARNKAIIQSMTPEERKNPKILNYSRRKRIAAGCGLQVQDVNRLIKQYEQTCDMMKKMSKSKRLPF